MFQVKRVASASLFALLLVAAPAVAAQPLSDDVSRRMALDAVAMASDDDLAALRETCAREQMPAIIARLAAQNVPMPPVADYCFAGISESLRRGNNGGLYLQLNPQHAFATLKAVIAAASANQTGYQVNGGAVQPLPCPLAFDAGVVMGYLNPEVAVPPEAAHLPDSDCYRPRANTSSRSGFLLGVLRGRAIAREHTALAD